MTTNIWMGKLLFLICSFSIGYHDTTFVCLLLPSINFYGRSKCFPMFKKMTFRALPDYLVFSLCCQWDQLFFFKTNLKTWSTELQAVIECSVKFKHHIFRRRGILCGGFFIKSIMQTAETKKVALSDHHVQKNICLLWLINVMVAFTATHLKGCNFDMYQFSSSEVDLLLANIINQGCL